MIIIALNTSFPKGLFKFSKQTKVLIIGDSHTECAINDSILNNSMNFSQSGDNYLYSYTKLTLFKKNNPKLKHVILSYSYFNLLEYQNDWYTAPRYIQFKGSKYFRHLDKESIIDIFLMNPKGAISSLPNILKDNFIKILKNSKDVKKYDYGEFLALNYIRKPSSELISKDENLYSEIQKKYLKKIYSFCMSNDIKLRLIVTPLYHSKELFSNKTIKEFNDFKENELTQADLFNYADFILNDTMFADNEHLNKYGAKVFSEFLNDELKITE